MPDATEAAAIARNTIKRAFEAGAFSSPVPTGLQNFLLKLRSTKLKKLAIWAEANAALFKADRDWINSTEWTEADYEYDDKRAADLIANAEKGNDVAAKILREAVIAHSTAFPPNLKAYLVGLLDRSAASGVRGQPSKFDRDLYIYHAVEGVMKLDFKTTRNEATDGRESASSIVSSVLNEFDIQISESSVARIWHKVHHSIPVKSVGN